MATRTPDQIIRALGLQAHPEGGHYHEIYRAAPAQAGGRSAMTSIHYLLQAGERSAWHRIDATEVWHFHDGVPLCLWVREKDGEMTETILGPDASAGQQAQVIIPPHAWQSAECQGDWTLVSCTVAPGFHFAEFEMAPGDVLPDD